MIDMGLRVHAQNQRAMLFRCLVHLLVEVCPFEHMEMMFKLYFGHAFNICTRWDAYCILNVDILK